MTDRPELPPPLPLLIAYAPAADRQWHEMSWQIDSMMARIVFGAREGAVAAIRLAWWEEALAASQIAAPADPLLRAWHDSQPTGEARDCVAAIAGAWRMLLDPAPMSDADWDGFAQGRGRLFGLVARQSDDAALAEYSARWALWDVAGRTPDRQRAAGAFAALMARTGSRPKDAISCKPLALISALVDDAMRDGRLPDGGFGLRAYLRLVRRSFFL